MMLFEAVGFAIWSYWRIIRTGHYPSSSVKPKPLFSATKGR